jgi:phosphoenolpyruvate-protein phosphotransferase (PTS system enzyme I)
MQTLQGIPVSPGIAIGEALILDNEGFRIPRRFVVRDAVDDELARLDSAMTTVAAEMERNRDSVAAQLGSQYGAIFGAHLQLLNDPQLRRELEELIRQQHLSSEYAISRTLRRYAAFFQQLESTSLAQRAHDFYDIEKSLLRTLLGKNRQAISDLDAPVIILAHDLTPSETATLDRRFVLGFATETGGAGGHTAIVAKGLEIPAVVGTGLFLADISGGDVVIVDGDHGQVILQPDDETLARFRRDVEQQRTLAIQLAGLRDLPAETLDGQRISLYANIEFPQEVDTAVERGADGIGLYRTEFLYLGAQAEPDEETHYQAYLRVAQAMGDRPVVIRTLDLGADKMGMVPRGEEEHNPFLGLRSIRLSLRNLSLFRIQLRALLRASAAGNVRVMFPLVTSLHELRSAKMVLADVMEDLEEEEVPFNREIPVGIMVETPATVVMLDRFLREVDFISIGTNDLVQYALAVDRSNKEVAELYQASDPAVLRLINLTLQASLKASVPASMCGQMSGSAHYTMLLLGLGLRHLSVPPSAISEVKRVVRAVSLPQCEAVSRRALTMDSAREVDKFLQEEVRKVAPDLLHT